MADMLDKEAWSAIKEDLQIFLSGYNPWGKKQLDSVQAARERLNERKLTKKELDQAYGEIKKEIKTSSAKKIYVSIEKYLELAPESSSQTGHDDHESEGGLSDVQKKNTENSDEKLPQQNEQHRQKESALLKEIRHYLGDRKIDVDDYSDEIGNYISAAGLNLAEKKQHLSDVIKALNKAIDRKNPPEKKALRPDYKKVANLALVIYSENEVKLNGDPDVYEAVKKLCGRLSKISRSGYIRACQKTGDNPKNDSFLNILETIKSVDNAQFIDRLAGQHISRMLKQMDAQNVATENKEQYIAFLMQNNYEQYIPKGDKKMSEDENTEIQDEAVVDENVDAAEAGEQNEATENQDAHKKPEGVLLKACYLAGIDWKDKTEEEIRGAVEAAGYVIDGGKILVKGQTPEGNEICEEARQCREEKIEAVDKALEGKDQLTDEEEATLKKALEDIDKKHAVDVFGNKNEEQPNEQNTDWIAVKRAQYEKFAANGVITNYTEDKTVENGFGATFDGGKITYTAENRVIVDPSSKIKAFETVLLEDSNIGRPINFADNMTPDMKARLYAACILHDNPMIGALPSADEIMQHKDMLKAELGEARYAEFVAKVQKGNGHDEHAENSQPENQPQEEKPSLKEALMDQYQMAKMEAEKKVTVDLSDKDNPKFSKVDENTTDDELKAYKEMYKRAAASKSFLAEQFANDPSAVRKAAGEIIVEIAEKANKNEQTLFSADDIHKVHIQALREKAAQIATNDGKSNALKDHEEYAANRAANRDRRDMEMAVALGIVADTEKKPLSGQELENYVKENKITQYTFERLVTKNQGVPMVSDGKSNFDVTKLSDAQKAVYDSLPKPEAQTTRDNSRSI